MSLPTRKKWTHSVNTLPSRFLLVKILTHELHKKYHSTKTTGTKITQTKLGELPKDGARIEGAGRHWGNDTVLWSRHAYALSCTRKVTFLWAFSISRPSVGVLGVDLGVDPYSGACRVSFNLFPCSCHRWITIMYDIVRDPILCMSTWRNSKHITILLNCIYLFENFADYIPDKSIKMYFNYL